MSEKCVICDKEANQKCSACKNVYYCSREHQKKDWRDHKKICQPFEICLCPKIGRYMRATRDINIGDIILMETPLVYGPKVYPIEHGAVPCLGCFKSVFLDSATRCMNCRWPICSQTCPGLKDPEKHAIECIILSMRKIKEPMDNLYQFFRHDTIFVLRCFLLQTRWPRKFQTLMNFETHFDKRGPNTEIYNITSERTVKYLQENFIEPFKVYEKNVDNTFLKEVSNELFHKIAGIVDVNCLEINDDVELSAIYEQASLMEHNCTPNTIHTFGNEDNNFRITIQAATQILQGERISTSYTNLLWGTFARNQHLNETKYFTCQCDRCQDPTEFKTYFSALHCSGINSTTNCIGFTLSIQPTNPFSDWICNQCSTKTPIDKVIKIIHEIGQGVEKLQNDTPTIGELELFLGKISTVLHPNHYHCFAIKHSLVQLYGYQQGYLAHQLSDELLDKKIELANSLIKITETLDTTHSRLNLYSAILYHELHLAKMQLLKRRWHNWPEDLVKQQLKHISQLIKKALGFLQYEQSSIAGRKLFNVISETNRLLIRWINDKNFNLED